MREGPWYIAIHSMGRYMGVSHKSVGPLLSVIRLLFTPLLPGPHPVAKSAARFHAASTVSQSGHHPLEAVQVDT